jgi:hypothetical protein
MPPTRPARAGRSLSVEVPPELLAALRAAAAERGQTLAELVRRTLAAEVGQSPAAGAAGGPAAAGLADRVGALEVAVAALQRGR